MKKMNLYLIVLVFIFLGCNSKNNQNQQSDPESIKEMNLLDSNDDIEEQLYTSPCLLELQQKVLFQSFNEMNGIESGVNGNSNKDNFIYDGIDWNLSDYSSLTDITNLLGNPISQTEQTVNNKSHVQKSANA